MTASRSISGAALHIHNSVIRKAVNGIIFEPASGNTELYVSDSVIMDTTEEGSLIVPSESSGVKAVMDGIRVETVVAVLMFKGPSPPVSSARR